MKLPEYIFYPNMAGLDENSSLEQIADKINEDRKQGQKMADEQIAGNGWIKIDRWFYTKPDLDPDKDGNIALISKQSFGPLEVYEWGIDSNKNAYELYKWLENDFYEDESYFDNIETEKLLKQIHLVISLFRDNELHEWADLYEKIIEWLYSNQII